MGFVIMNEGKHMISIIVPIYNSEKWLQRCVESLVAQTYQDIEILLINDGSTDNSINICKKFAEDDQRVIVIDKPNEGVSATRNLGIKTAKGDYIQFVDSDDYIEPQMCESLVKTMGNSDLAVCGMRIWKNGAVLREPHISGGIYDLRQDIHFYFTLRRINLAPYNKLYKKNKITALFREGLSLGEDTLFVLEYLKNVERISVLSECLYNVVLDNENSLNKKHPDNALDLLIEQRKEEEAFLLDCYGKNCDLTPLYNCYLLNTHAYFLNKVRAKQHIQDAISKYIKNDFLQEKIKRAAPGRLDLKLFQTIFSKKRVRAVNAYFHVKALYYSLRGI